MTNAVIIDGRHEAALMRLRIQSEIRQLESSYKLKPGLAMVMVGDNPASEIYVRRKVQACQEVGIASFVIRLPANVGEKQLLRKIDQLNRDPKIHGILVQLPLPASIHPGVIVDHIYPDKDVDGFHADNMGRLITGQKQGLFPCTPLGCMHLLRSLQPDILRSHLAGYKAVVIGRSNIVGKPLSLMLLQADCTVTMVHSRTVCPEEEIAEADIVVAALGKASWLRGSWLKPGAVVLDVGINHAMRPDGSVDLVGDVAFDEAVKVAAAITPVPGGVGPMTVAYLLHNTVKAMCYQKQIYFPRDTESGNR